MLSICNILELTERAQKGLPEVFNKLLSVLDNGKPVLFNEAAKKINYRDYDTKFLEFAQSVCLSKLCGYLSPSRNTAPILFAGI